MTQTTARLALSYLQTATPLPLGAELAVTVAVVLTKWSRRQRSRRALAQLDDHLLQDVGLDRRAAHIEARRMFWQG